MRAWTAERLGAAGGIAFVVLSLIGDLIAGSLPKTDDTPSKISAFFIDHHRAVILGVILTGIAAPGFVALVGALALRLRAAGEGGWAVLAFAFGVTGAALAVASDALFGTLARIGTQGDPGLTKGVYQLAGFFTQKAFWFAAAIALVVGIAAWRALPRWYAWLSFAAIVFFALGGISVKQAGFLAPYGAMTLIAFLALLVWVLATSVVIWRLAPTYEAAATARPSPE